MLSGFELYSPDLFKLGWRPVGQRKKQHLPYNVFKALCLED